MKIVSINLILEAPIGIVARFKKKEDIGRMTKSILKHKIQTLTGKSIKNLEEEMGYKAKNPNESSMDVETMRSLASSLVLLACDELPDYMDISPTRGIKRPASSSAEAGTSASKASRRSLPSAEKPRTPSKSRTSKTDLNQNAGSSVSQVSMSVTICLGPNKDMTDHLVAVQEEAGANPSVANPTPAMKEMLERRMVASKASKTKSAK